MVLSWIFVRKGVNVEGCVPKPVGKMVLDATNLRSCNLFQLDDGDYITLEELVRKPTAEMSSLIEQLEIPVRKLNRVVQSFGGDADDEGEDEGEEGEEEEEEEEEEAEESDPDSEESLRRKEVRNKKEHDAMTHEERVVALLRQQNQMIEEGFSFMKAQFVTMNQRLDRLEASSSRGGAEDAEDSEDDSS
ncbi:PREDICTED: stimulated by retinoic acid gene 8 protein-like [Ipomoea nil]|uniref:stimulated by retinoic acid gene 8 protein-like n=1 Tax=Ipomoea nil TaxID=35883 RepID=UPI000900DD41|nr:PREDICTED: stimulated by retinoic acid gene 8 protein-like [Ipomoea nil]